MEATLAIYGFIFIIFISWAILILVPASTLYCLYGFYFKKPWKKSALKVTGGIYFVSALIYLVLQLLLG